MENNDLAEGTVSQQRIDVSEYEIGTKKQLHAFRNIAFWGSVIIVVFFYFALLCFVFNNPQDIGKGNNNYLAITITVVLATIPTLIALALMRHSFQSTAEDPKSVDLSLTHVLIKELRQCIRLLTGNKSYGE